MKPRRIHVSVVQPPRPHYVVFAWMDCCRNLIAMFAVGVN